MFCPNCGSENKEGTLYCIKCGCNLQSQTNGPSYNPNQNYNNVNQNNNPGYYQNQNGYNPNGNMNQNYNQNYNPNYNMNPYNNTGTMRPKKSVVQQWWFWLIIVLIAGVIILAVIGSQSSKKTNSGVSSNTNKSTNTNSSSNKNSNSSTTKNTPVSNVNTKIVFCENVDSNMQPINTSDTFTAGKLYAYLNYGTKLNTTKLKITIYKQDGGSESVYDSGEEDCDSDWQTVAVPITLEEGTYRVVFYSSADGKKIGEGNIDVVSQ